MTSPLQNRADGIRHRAEKFLLLLVELANPLGMGGHHPVHPVLDQHRHAHPRNRAMFREQFGRGKPGFSAKVVDHNRNPFPDRISGLRMGAAFDREFADEIAA